MEHCDCVSCRLQRMFMVKTDLVPSCQRCGHRGYDFIGFDNEDEENEYYEYECENCKALRVFPEPKTVRFEEREKGGAGSR